MRIKILNFDFKKCRENRKIHLIIFTFTHLVISLGLLVQGQLLGHRALNGIFGVLQLTNKKVTSTLCTLVVTNKNKNNK